MEVDKALGGADDVVGCSMTELARSSSISSRLTLIDEFMFVDAIAASSKLLLELLAFCWSNNRAFCRLVVVVVDKSWLVDPLPPSRHPAGGCVMLKFEELNEDEELEVKMMQAPDAEEEEDDDELEEDEELLGEQLVRPAALPLVITAEQLLLEEASEEANEAETGVCCWLEVGVKWEPPMELEASEPWPESEEPQESKVSCCCELPALFNCFWMFFSEARFWFSWARAACSLGPA